MKLRAFLLDDNSDIRNLIEIAMKQRNYEVIAFADPSESPLWKPHECNCKPGTTCADLILSDMDMPQVPGLTFIESQIDKGCKIKHIALMSGAWDQSDRQRALRLGCKVFDKPLSLDELNEWLDECERDIPPYRTLINWFAGEASVNPASQPPPQA